MLEDLRNYRAQGFAGASPNSTMVIGGGSPAATVASGNLGGHGFPGHALSGHAPATDDPTVVATSRSPRERAAAPWPTPVVPRTGTMQSTPVEPPKKKSVVGTIFAALALVGVIVYGANKIKPVFEAARALHNAQVKETPSSRSAEPAPRAATRNSEASPSADAPQGPHEASTSARDTVAEVKSADPSPEKAAPRRPDDAAASAGAGSDDSSHPLPAPGRGAIHVVTDVIGATALLQGPAGHVLGKCETPCSFNNLTPQRYGLEVQKDGYQPVQTALQIKGDEAQDQKIKLEPLARGIFISTEPPGADVFINGAKQSGQTPVTLPLAPGQYNLVLRLSGYEAHSGTIQVTDIQTQLKVPLTERSATRVAR